jgi:Uma2 family endonuclease
MSIGSTISVEEYVGTSYRPDCDYVDGYLVARNVGLRDHSELQGGVLMWFYERRRSLCLDPFLSLRIQVSPYRFRVPDVCVVQRPEPKEQILTQPPYICIEVLSPEDTFLQMQDRFDDYLAMGVTNVWVIDPASRRAWSIAREGHLEALDSVLSTSDTKVKLPIADLFSNED